MQAAYIDGHGGPEVFVFGALPDPVAGPGEVVVDIKAASVNGADWKVRNGTSIPDKSFPYVMGRDFSGLVRAVGAGVTEFAPGDAVFGVCDEGQEGTYAEQIAIRAAIIARKPEPMSHLEAAALSLAGLTALVAVEDVLKLKRGETILIQGGAGGVAGFAIQLAKHLGASVVTTTSTRNVEYVKGLGVDHAIDYTQEDFEKVSPACDAVFDTVGGKVAERAFAVLKPGGRAAFIASGRIPPEAPSVDMKSFRPKVGRDRRYLERISSLFESGAVRAPDIQTYSLAQASDAHKLSESRHFRGKLVFEI